MGTTKIPSCSVSSTLQKGTITLFHRGSTPLVLNYINRCQTGMLQMFRTTSFRMITESPGGSHLAFSQRRQLIMLFCLLQLIKPREMTEKATDEAKQKALEAERKALPFRGAEEKSSGNAGGSDPKRQKPCLCHCMEFVQ